MPKSLAALTAALLLAGCTAAPTPPTASTAQTAPTSSVASSAASPSRSPSATPVVEPSKAVQVIKITLKGGKATPNGDRVTLEKGTILRLEITSDHTDEVHVHGYDVEIAAKAGATVTKDITLDQVGRFEVESHEPALTVLQLVVS
jgi:hypothetical protein